MEGGLSKLCARRRYQVLKSDEVGGPRRCKRVMREGQRRGRVPVKCLQGTHEDHRRGTVRRRGRTPTSKMCPSSPPPPRHPWPAEPSRAGVGDTDKAGSGVGRSGEGGEVARGGRGGGGRALPSRNNRGRLRKCFQPGAMPARRVSCRYDYDALCDLNEGRMRLFSASIAPRRAWRVLRRVCVYLPRLPRRGLLPKHAPCRPSVCATA